MDEKFNVEDSFHCARCFQSWCADSPSCPTRYAGHLCRRSICLSMENCVLHLAHDMAPQIHEFPMVSFYNQVLFVILGLSLRRSPCFFERKWWVLMSAVYPFVPVSMLGAWNVWKFRCSLIVFQLFYHRSQKCHWMICQYCCKSLEVESAWIRFFRWRGHARFNSPWTLVQWWLEFLRELRKPLIVTPKDHVIGGLGRPQLRQWRPPFFLVFYFGAGKACSNSLRGAVKISGWWVWATIKPQNDANGWLLKGWSSFPKIKQQH